MLAKATDPGFKCYEKRLTHYAAGGWSFTIFHRDYYCSDVNGFKLSDDCKAVLLVAHSEPHLRLEIFFRLVAVDDGQALGFSVSHLRRAEDALPGDDTFVATVTVHFGPGPANSLAFQQTLTHSETPLSIFSASFLSRSVYKHWQNLSQPNDHCLSCSQKRRHLHVDISVDRACARPAARIKRRRV
jgi:hypothetical protein